MVKDIELLRPDEPGEGHFYIYEYGLCRPRGSDFRSSKMSLSGYQIRVHHQNESQWVYFFEHRFSIESIDYNKKSFS